MNKDLLKIQQGRHHDPFRVLGRHTLDDEREILRVFLPQAEQVEILGLGLLNRIEGSDMFAQIRSKSEPLETHYRLRWQVKGTGEWQEQICPYSFSPQLGEMDVHLFTEGKHHHAYRFLGAHHQCIDGIDGCLFALWVPNAERVSVVGDFNQWDGRRHPMRCLGSSGIWELFIPELPIGAAYKYEIRNQHGHCLLKTDPYAQAMALRPDNTSHIADPQPFDWQDQAWLQKREQSDWQQQPLSIYEVHVGSWQRDQNHHFLNWRTLAKTLLPYVKSMGYSHIELLPIAEHPLDQSWGYQVTGFFAPSARHGSPEDLRYFIDQCHQQGVGVLLDWVPAHFPKDEFALAKFNGEAVYEHADPRQGEHQDWGTLIFNYGRTEVRNFLITNAIYWLEEFHIDGLRVDAVASMLYLDYSREDGQWLPNAHGGRENLEAIAFLRDMNSTVHQLFPGVLTIAEESTAWPMVTRPVDVGGLGFSMKWNMGWMNDNLSYIELDPIYRQYHHDQLTFSQMYAYSENFVLPLSHDEVVHGKRSLLSKMPGNDWEKMANLRLFYAWQFANPGKKLLFMGGELGQWQEWNEATALAWDEASTPAHQGIQTLVRDLNQLYRQEPALHELDFSAEGFQWIDCHDVQQSVLSFVRWSAEHQQHIVCVHNFTPLVRAHYRLGVPASHAYREIFNSDSHYYGGSNQGNAAHIEVSDNPWMGFSHSIEITLPPLASLFLKERP